ncbi:type II toxin-antitoxin system VapC family toxin [Pseudoduganella rhizocola]|uniref:type II toxin-antitoxin system VapC family toxin n=1 Tax=Pseudoduganella rhizocola TaxID=3382643 RepID=UPI0038B4BB97
MYLIDTNVISEYRKGARANPGVAAFFATTDENTLFLPPQVVGEIQAGIEHLRRRRDVAQAERAHAYEQWLDGLINRFGDRILEFDTDAARLWGALLSNQKKDPHTVDKQIAAIALLRNLTVVTRDKGDAFSRIPKLTVLNPFLGG